jgi:D-alanyl-D-alanine carboxypeptidase (penicillin-binding protein 5/6)
VLGLLAAAGGVWPPAAEAAPASSRLPPMPPMNVRGFCLIAAATGQRLAAEHPRSELPIASTTKLMTALVVLQHVRNLSTVYAQNDWLPAPDDSQLGLRPGQRMTVRGLIIAMMLPSADDAAEDLAYHVGGGSIARFVGWMNADARALGLSRTHFSTPIGLDRPGNYSSPCDLAALARYDLEHEPFLRHVVALKAATVRVDGRPRRVVNINYLLDLYPWVNGVKTGHTADAGYVLVASGTRDGMTLIDAVLHASSIAARERDALALLRYGFGNFQLVRAVQAGAVIARLPVSQRPGVRAAVIAGSSFARVLPRAWPLVRRLALPRSLSGPLPAHARVGALELEQRGHVLARIPLLLARRLRAVSALTIAARILLRGTTLVGLGLALAALLSLLAVARRARPRGRDRVHDQSA